MRPRAGGTAYRPPAPRAFPTRQQAPVAGRVPLPATGAYHSRSEASRGLSNPVRIHLNFALGLSNEVGPPQDAILRTPPRNLTDPRSKQPSHPSLSFPNPATFDGHISAILQGR